MCIFCAINKIKPENRKCYRLTVKGKVLSLPDMGAIHFLDILDEQ